MANNSGVYPWTSSGFVMMMLALFHGCSSVDLSVMAADQSHPFPRSQSASHYANEASFRPIGRSSRLQKQLSSYIYHVKNSVCGTCAVLWHIRCCGLLQGWCCGRPPSGCLQPRPGLGVDRLVASSFWSSSLWLLSLWLYPNIRMKSLHEWSWSSKSTSVQRVRLELLLCL